MSDYCDDYDDEYDDDAAEYWDEDEGSDEECDDGVFFGYEKPPYNGPKIDAEYLNNWLPEEDEVLDLGARNLFLIKNVLEYYGPILSPGRKFNVKFSSESDIEQLPRVVAAADVIIPYGVVADGNIDIAIGYTMRAFRKNEHVSPGNTYYSSSWDIFTTVLKSIKMDVNGKSVSMFRVISEAIKVNPRLSMMLRDRDNAQQFFSGTYHRGFKGASRVVADFIYQSVKDIHQFISTFEDIKLDTTANPSIKKYYQKLVNKGWEAYQKVRGDLFKDGSVAYKLLEFRFYFYGMHDNVKASRGVTLGKIQKASERQLAKLAAMSFMPEIFSLVTDYSEKALNCLQLDLTDSSVWNDDKSALHDVGNTLRKSEAFTKKTRLDNAKITTTKDPLRGEDLGSVYISKGKSYVNESSDPDTYGVFNAGIDPYYNDNFLKGEGASFSDTVTSQVSPDCIHGKAEIPEDLKAKVETYTIHRGYKRFWCNDSISIGGQPHPIDYHVTVVDVL